MTFKNLGWVLVLCLSFSVYASDLDRSPPSFELTLASMDTKAVFADFSQATYTITYDLSARTATAIAEITLETTEEGALLFDLVPTPTSVSVDGESVAVERIRDPDSRTYLRVTQRVIPAGEHTLVVENTISKNVRFDPKGVSSAFWMSDLDDRGFLEQYMASNLEYDHFKMTFDIQFVNGEANQRFYTNGTVEEISNDHYKIEFPDTFTTSSAFYHTAPEDSFYEADGTYESIDGRKIPVHVYTRYNQQTAQNYLSKALEVLEELENDYGVWPNETVEIYGAGMGGMEYVGATITDLWALGHELTHSYFARGVMPRNGDSGWVDEAIASWRDEGYRAKNRPSFRSNMGNQSLYKRTTDMRAYRQGRDFLSYLNKRFLDQGGLKPYLADLFGDYVFKSITSKEFQSYLEEKSGMDLAEDFNQFIYDIDSEDDNEKFKVGTHFIEPRMENPYHPRLTKEQLESLL